MELTQPGSTPGKSKIGALSMLAFDFSYSRASKLSCQSAEVRLAKINSKSIAYESVLNLQSPEVWRKTAREKESQVSFDAA
jgi:hypothetical protein